MTVVPAAVAGRSDSRQTCALALLPGAGRALATTRLLSGSMMTCAFAENRWFLDEAPIVRSRTGMRPRRRRAAASAPAPAVAAGAG